MGNAADFVQFQADCHPIELDANFATVEEYCLHLLHMKAYEEATSMAHGKIVLDLGCNNGYGTAAISHASARIVGLDVSPQALDTARRRFGALPGVEFQHYDSRRIPFDDGSFDLVVSFQVIEHVENTKDYLAEISRVLKPGGVALFTTPNATIRLDPGMSPWNKFHVREYKAEELADTLRLAFSEVSVQGLFAIDELYRIEFERCQSALRQAREGTSPFPPPPIALSALFRERAVAVAKAVLPKPLLESIRAHRHTQNTVQRRLDPAIISKYSTRDVFYRHDGLTRALDLMAICRNSLKHDRVLRPS